MDLNITPKQKQFIDAEASEVLFGGAAGGSTSAEFTALVATKTNWTITMI